MSETPERKVLKEMLGKLKEKNLASKDRYRRFQTHTKEIFNVHADEAGKHVEKGTKLNPVAIFGVVMSLRHYLSSLCSHFETALEDLEIYVEALEQYSTELDRTLTNIFQQAKKRFEEEQKKQEELSKRKPTGQEIA